MHQELIAALGVDDSRTVYLEDTGHMSGIDSLFALDAPPARACCPPGTSLC
jgi:3-oxoacyl-[acyl-carrier-protein] synthase III